MSSSGGRGGEMLLGVEILDGPEGTFEDKSMKAGV
jgi:hypothetical protein